MYEKILKIFFYAFYAAVLGVTSLQNHPPVQIPPSSLLRELATGRDRGYIPPGSELAELSKVIPKKGTVTFLFDNPFGPYAPNIETLYAAQSYLAPLILNPDPGEKYGIIDCSNHFIADQRLRDTGYQLARIFADGKALIVKS